MTIPETETEIVSEFSLFEDWMDKYNYIIDLGKVFYRADSDAIITKGIANLLIRVLSDHSPDEIIHADLSFLDKIGLREHLSPTRSNGLNSMIKQMKLYAIVFQTKYPPA